MPYRNGTEEIQYRSHMYGCYLFYGATETGKTERSHCTDDMDVVIVRENLLCVRVCVCFHR